MVKFMKYYVTDGTVKVPVSYSAAEGVDNRPGSYYVSVIRGADYRLLLGPFENDHAVALEMVEAVRKKD